MQPVPLLRHAGLSAHLLPVPIGDLDVDGGRARVGRVHREAGRLPGEHAARLEAGAEGAHLVGVWLGFAVPRGDGHSEGRSGNVLVPELDGDVVVALLGGSVLDCGRGVQVQGFGLFLQILQKTVQDTYITNPYNNQILKGNLLLSIF